MMTIQRIMMVLWAFLIVGSAEHKSVPDFKFGLLVGNSMKTLDVRENQWLVYKVVAD